MARFEDLKVNQLTGRRLEIYQKVRERIRFVDPPEGVEDYCWIWQGPTSGSGRGGGYPRMNLDNCTVAVHRTIWQVFFGPLSSKRQLDHLCRRRCCVNPLHAENTTHKQNQKRRDLALKKKK